MIRLQVQLGTLALVACGGTPDDVVTTNQPVRIVSQSMRPAQREPPPLRLGPGCLSPEPFSVRASDPNRSDTIRATWFIDPNDRYVPGPQHPVFSGNPGSPIQGSDERVITAPSALYTALASFADGRRHRVEVVVTDGDFVESSVGDPVSSESRPFLDVVRAPVRLASGNVVPVQAFRDDTVWFVEVSTTPCP
jgi:hypothetical protein